MERLLAARHEATERGASINLLPVVTDLRAFGCATRIGKSGLSQLADNYRIHFIVQPGVTKRRRRVNPIPLIWRFHLTCFSLRVEQPPCRVSYRGACRAFMDTCFFRFSYLLI
jgi:hypothetical protein